MNDVDAQHVGIIQPSLHPPQLFFQLFPRVLLSALGQVRLELLLEVLLGLHHQLFQQLLQFVDQSLLAGESQPLALAQYVREDKRAVMLLKSLYFDCDWIQN